MIKYRSAFGFFSILLLLFAAPFCVHAEECISADDLGKNYTIMVRSNPQLSMGGSDYNGGKQSQRAIWVDTGLLTNGSEFTIEIQGLWTAWYAGVAPSGVETLVVPPTSLCIMGYQNAYNSTHNSGNQRLITENYSSNEIIPDVVSKDNLDSINYKSIRNYPSELIGVRGEYDFVRSVYENIVVGNGSEMFKGLPANESLLLKSSSLYNQHCSGRDFCVETFKLEDRFQQNCWLTAGEGLYVAFFGRYGNDLPQLATHLKASNIICDPEYMKDFNGSGFVSIDECVDENGLIRAYFTPGTTRCDEDYDNYKIIKKDANGIPLLDERGFQIVLRDDDKPYVDGCYSLNEKKEKEDKTIFVYRAKFFYSDDKGNKIGKNQRIKFMIYDKFYSDNRGYYTVNILSGASDPNELKIIEEILGNLESIFGGERDEFGELQGGVLKKYYNYVVQDSLLSNIFRILVVLYMTFAGFRFALGMTQYTTKEMMILMLKLTFVLAFTSPASWNLYDEWFVRFFMDGMSSAVVMISKAIDYTFSFHGGETLGGIGGLANKFSFMDDYIKAIFSRQVGLRMLGFVFGVWYGFIVVPILYFLLLYFVWNLIKALYPYLITFVQIVLALALGPIFISLYLFETTKSYFDNWLAFLGGKFINILFLFGFLYSFASFIMRRIEIFISGYETCKMPIWEAITSAEGAFFKSFASVMSLGINVWKTKGITMTFIQACIEILMIVVLIYLFKQLLEKLPTIVDSMIDKIGEGSAGGLDPATKKSALANDLGNLSDDLNSVFTYNVDNGKGGKSSVGLFSTDFVKRGPIGGVARKSKGLATKGAKFASGRIKGAIANSKLGEAVGKIKSAKDDFDLDYDVPGTIGGGKSELLGNDFVEAYAKNYRAALEKAGRSNIDQEVEKFRQKQLDDSVRKPLEEAAREAAKKAENTAQFDDMMRKKVKEMFDYGDLESRKQFFIAGDRRSIDPSVNKNTYVYNGEHRDHFDAGYYDKFWQNSRYRKYVESRYNDRGSEFAKTGQQARLDQLSKIGKEFMLKEDSFDGLSAFNKSFNERMKLQEKELKKIKNEEERKAIEERRQKAIEKKEAAEKEYKESLRKEYEETIGKMRTTSEKIREALDKGGEFDPSVIEENRRAATLLRVLSEEIQKSPEGIILPGLPNDFVLSGTNELGLGAGKVEDLIGLDTKALGLEGYASPVDVNVLTEKQKQEKAFKETRQKIAKQEKKIAEYDEAVMVQKIKDSTDEDQKRNFNVELDQIKARIKKADDDIRSNEV